MQQTQKIRFAQIEWTFNPHAPHELDPADKRRSRWIRSTKTGA
jgi:hypothetical protein